MDTIVATDGWDQAVSRYLFGSQEDRQVRQPYEGKLLWRVQLRRGLVPFKGKQLPATAVIGVEFTDKEVQPSKEAVSGMPATRFFFYWNQQRILLPGKLTLL
jgi:hypothetical protein